MLKVVEGETVSDTDCDVDSDAENEADSEGEIDAVTDGDGASSPTKKENPQASGELYVPVSAQGKLSSILFTNKVVAPVHTKVNCNERGLFSQGQSVDPFEYKWYK